MNNSRFKPKYERWAYQIFDESVECLKDGLNPLSDDLEGKKLVISMKKREHAVFCIVRYLELCNSTVHGYLSRANIETATESHLKANVRELFTKSIEGCNRQSDQSHFLNFLQWLIPLAVDAD